MTPVSMVIDEETERFTCDMPDTPVMKLDLNQQST